MREIQMQKMIKELSEMRNDQTDKDTLIKKLKYENERLFNECANLKNNQVIMGLNN
jgi:hypothetical protein